MKKLFQYHLTDTTLRILLSNIFILLFLSLASETGYGLAPVSRGFSIFSEDMQRGLEKLLNDSRLSMQRELLRDYPNARGFDAVIRKFQKKKEPRIASLIHLPGYLESLTITERRRLEKSISIERIKGPVVKEQFQSLITPGDPMYIPFEVVFFKIPDSEDWIAIKGFTDALTTIPQFFADKYPMVLFDVICHNHVSQKHARPSLNDLLVHYHENINGFPKVIILGQDGLCRYSGLKIRTLQNRRWLVMPGVWTGDIEARTLSEFRTRYSDAPDDMLDRLDSLPNDPWVDKFTDLALTIAMADVQFVAWDSSQDIEFQGTTISWLNSLGSDDPQILVSAIRVFFTLTRNKPGDWVELFEVYAREMPEPLQLLILDWIWEWKFGKLRETYLVPFTHSRFESVSGSAVKSLERLGIRPRASSGIATSG